MGHNPEDWTDITECPLESAYLIDDRLNHGADEFGDHWIQLGSDRFPDWKSVVEYLMNI